MVDLIEGFNFAQNPAKAKKTRKVIVVEGLYLNYGDLVPLSIGALWIISKCVCVCVVYECYVILFHILYSVLYTSLPSH